MWKKVAVFSLVVAVLSSAKGSPTSRQSLWNKLAQLMLERNTQTGTCGSNACFVEIDGKTFPLEENQQFTHPSGPCLEFFCTRDDVIEHAIQCSNVPCREGEEPVNYPNICCPVCEGEGGDGTCETTEWSEWSECSRTCDNGVDVGKHARVRSFEIVQGADSIFCDEILSEVRDCNVNVGCPVDCLWEWEEFGDCDRTCGGGVRQRVPRIIRQAENGGQECPPYLLNGVPQTVPDTEACNTFECPIDCIWEWEAFEPCSRSCGGGTRRRDPFIIRQGEHGGQECPPYLLNGVPQTVPDTEACNTFECPIDCIWEWEAFEPCSHSCGGGTRRRDPLIIRQGEHGGQECPPYLLNGVPQTVPDTEACNTFECPIHCIWEWETFEPCSHSCGGGTRSRDPFIIRQGEHGGQECPPYLLNGVPQTVPDTEACNNFECPIDCIWEWEAFGPCSKTCGGGTKSRDPFIIRQGEHGGQECPPYLLNSVPQTVPDTEECNTITCPKCELKECTINGEMRCIDPLDDPDDDCIPTETDNCPKMFNPDQSDVDGDGLGDVCDPCDKTPPEGPTDQDGDKVEDACDNCMKRANMDQRNSDDDDTGDVCDIDDDNDGKNDDDDNCQFVYNPNQRDTDDDKYGDECDNCPNDKNTNQNDKDGDGVGNACDNCRLIPNSDQELPENPEDCGNQVYEMGDDKAMDGDKKTLAAEIMEMLLDMYYSK